MAKTYKVSTVEVSAQSRKEWLARRRGKGEVATSASAVVVQSEDSSAPSALDALFRQVNIGTDDAPKYVAEALFPLRIGDALLDWHADQKYLGVEHATETEKANFFATGGVTAGGIGSSSGGSGEGGSSTLAGLNDVALKNTIANDMLVYNGTHWINTPMSTIKHDLTAYATKTWVEDKGYALNSALLKVDDRLADVETIFTADQDGAINKWSEVVAFLEGIEGDTLDSILAQFATIQWVENKKYITAYALEPYALKTAIPTKNSELENDAEYITAAALNGYATQNWVEGKKYLDGITSEMVTTAIGYTPYNAANFTKANIKSTLGISDWALAASKPSYKWSEINERPVKLSQFTDDVVSGNYLPIDGTAKNAGKLGNQAPTYYATASALSTLSTAVTEFRTLFDSLFEKDTANNAIKAKLSLYSVEGITAGGIGSGSSSGGGGASYNRLDAWADYTNDKSGWVLSALLGKDLDTRVNALANAGYITASALDPYAKSTDVANTYATQTALQGVDIRVQAIEYIFEEDQDGAINKWSEVVAFLDGIEGDTLDSILAQFATMQWVEGKKYITADALAPYALETSIPTKNSELENDAEYITSAALNGYATQKWVEDQKYLDGINSSMVIDALGYTPYNAANFTKANIKSTLGISDWALAASKPSYKWSEINERPTKLSQFTDDVVSGKYLKINGTAPSSNTLQWASFTAASGIGFNLHQWFASGKVSDIPSMGYSTVWQAGLNMSRAWQIWVSRTDHATHTRHTDGTNWTEEYTLLDDHNFGNYALPLSGGEMSGGISTPWVNGVIYAKSDAVGANNSGSLRFGAYDEVGGAKIQFGADSNTKIEVVNRSWNKALFSIDTSGNVNVVGQLRLGDAILSWDATNKCVTIKNANTGEKASLFVDGGVTATAIN